MGSPSSAGARFDGGEDVERPLGLDHDDQQGVGHVEHHGIDEGVDVDAGVEGMQLGVGGAPDLEKLVGEAFAVGVRDVHHAHGRDVRIRYRDLTDDLLGEQLTLENVRRTGAPEESVGIVRVETIRLVGEGGAGRRRRDENAGIAATDEVVDRGDGVARAIRTHDEGHPEGARKMVDALLGEHPPLLVAQIRIGPVVVADHHRERATPVEPAHLVDLANGQLGRVRARRLGGVAEPEDPAEHHRRLLTHERRARQGLGLDDDAVAVGIVGELSGAHAVHAGAAAESNATVVTGGAAFGVGAEPLHARTPQAEHLGAGRVRRAVRSGDVRERAARNHHGRRQQQRHGRGGPKQATGHGCPGYP